MSNIPFNTIASVLNVGNVQRQAATTATKKTTDEKQVQQIFQAEAARHAEEVEDPGNSDIAAIGEEPDHHNQQQKRKRQKHEEEPAREITDIAQLSAEAANAPTLAARLKIPNLPPKSLDISA